MLSHITETPERCYSIIVDDDSNTMINQCNTFLRCLITFIGSVALIACNEEDVNLNGNDIESVSEFLINESGLTITLFTDDEDNDTYYFDAVLFNFSEDGSVVATYANETVSGSYLVFRDNGRIELRMSFPDIQNFNELNDDWYFVSISQNTIRFNDDGDRLEFRQQ